MKQIDKLRLRFPYVKNVNDTDVSKEKSHINLFEAHFVRHDPADEIIYAARSFCGFPDSGLNVNRSMLNDSSVQIAMSQRMNGSRDVRGYNDEELSLEMMKRRFEDDNVYQERLTSIIKQEQEKAKALRKEKNDENT